MTFIASQVLWSPRLDERARTALGISPGPADDALDTSDTASTGTVGTGTIPGSTVRLTDPIASFAATALASATEAQLTAFGRLSGEQKQQFINVYGIVPAGDQRVLLDQLTRGRLTARDSQGQSTLSHLDRARTVPMGLPTGEDGPTYRARQISAVIEQVASPVNVFQGQRNTCGPTVAQLIFATVRPADYAGFAVGLLSDQGVGRLPNGQTIAREASAFSAANDSRPAVSRMIQASLMNWASPVSYSDRTDRHGVELPLVGRVDVASGASGVMVAQWMQAMRRDNSETLATSDLSELFDGGGPVTGVRDEDVVTAIAQDLQRQQQNGQPAFVPVELEWRTDKSMHWVAATAVTRDRVYFTNPHGNQFNNYRNDEQKHPRPLLRDPANGLDYVEARYVEGGPIVRFYTDGTQSMARNVMQDRVLTAVVDGGIASHHYHSPQNQFNPPF